MSIFTNVRFLYCHWILCALCSRFLYVDDVLEGFLYRFDYMSITIVSALLQIYALSTTLVFVPFQLTTIITTASTRETCRLVYASVATSGCASDISEPSWPAPIAARAPASWSRPAAGGRRAPCHCWWWCCRTGDPSAPPCRAPSRWSPSGRRPANYAKQCAN